MDGRCFRTQRTWKASRLSFNGLKLFAAPWVPKLDGWAYFQTDNELRQQWEQIPDDTNVLITHTPPLGILDRNRRSKPQGCPLLRSRIEELADLKLHVFGHIHESYGMEVINGVTFCNAALQDGKRLRKPMVVEL